MPITSAARRASLASSSVQQPRAPVRYEDGFSDSARWTPVTSWPASAARAAAVAESTPPDMAASTLSPPIPLRLCGSMACPLCRLTERPADLGRDEARMVADHPGRESQHFVVFQLQIVGPVHVVPVLKRIHMLDTIDFHDDLGILPEDVEVPAPPLGIWTASLPVRLRQPVTPYYQTSEVELGERLRAAGDVAECLADEPAPV